MVSQRHRTIQVSSKICEQLELSDLISGVGSFPKKPGQDSRPAPPLSIPVNQPIRIDREHHRDVSAIGQSQ